MNCYIFYDGADWYIQPSSNITSGTDGGGWGFTKLAGAALPSWTHVYQSDTLAGAVSFVDAASAGNPSGAASLIYAAS